MTLHADVDAADALRIERVALVLAVGSGEAQREILHGTLPFPTDRGVPVVRFADDARRGLHRVVIDLHRLGQQCHHVANVGRITSIERQFAIGRKGVVDAERRIEHRLRVVQLMFLK